METKVTIHTEYITLGQLIKLLHLIGSGGEEKAFLQAHEIYVGAEKENRRGKKLRPDDRIKIDGKEYLICSSPK